MLRLGIRAANLPAQAESNILIEFIQGQYGGHSLEELELAFTLAITRQLDLPDDKIPCYENFSCEYFARIMASYRRWARQQYPQLVVGDIPKSGEEEKLDVPAMTAWIQEIGQLIKEGRPPELLPVQLYDWMVQQGNLAPSEEDLDIALVSALGRREKFLKAMQEERLDVAGSYSRFIEQKARGYFMGFERKVLLDLQKQILIWEYFMGHRIEEKIYTNQE